MQPQTRRPRTVRALIDEYSARRMRRSRPGSKCKYVYAVDHWADLLGREPELPDLNDEAVSEFQDQLLELAGLSDWTVQSYTKKLTTLWRFGNQMHWVYSWPMVDVLQPAEIVPTAWTESQLRTLFAALRNQTGFIGCVPAAGWWVALHCLLWDSCGRIGEALATRWENVTLDGANPCVVFPAATRKGRRRPIVREIHPRTIQALRDIEEPKRDRVLPFPYDAGTLWNRYRGILKNAGLPSGRERMFHCLRKSGASHLEAAGINSTPLLDHSDRAVTLKHYIDPRIARPVQPASVLFRPDAPDDGPPRAA